MEEGKKVFKIITEFSSPDCEYGVHQYERTYKTASLSDAVDIHDRDIEKVFGDRVYEHTFRADELKEIDGKKERILLSSFGLFEI